jgi:hypothetical protein
MVPSSRFIPARAAFARVGPAANRSPPSQLLCSPPTPFRFGLGSGSPCLRPTHSVERLFLAGISTRPKRCHRGGLVSGSPGHRFFSVGQVRVLPGYWAAPFMYAVVVHPAGRFDTSPYRGIVAAVFRQTETLDVRNDRFRGCIPTAHMFAYLRIDILISQAAARLATSPPGSALTGQDLHLLGDVSEFHGIIVFTREWKVYPGMITRRSAWGARKDGGCFSARGFLAGAANPCCEEKPDGARVGA